jgi:PAS domain S-box-containing protein
MDYPAGMETRFDELKRYVRFTPDDARRLVGFRDVAAPHFARIAQEFYERIREHEGAHAVLTGEEQVARLQRSLVGWLERLLGGRYDERYFEQTQQIGRVHVRVGLPQRYMLTAMAMIRASLTAIAAAAAAVDPINDVREALSRILDLELAIMLEGYREDMVARIEHVAEAEREVLSKRALRAERRYIDAVELADAMMVGLSSDGKVLLFNKEAERVIGFARDEVLGRDFAELVLPADLREMHAHFFRVTGVSRSIELPLRTRAGKLRDVRWRIVPAMSIEDAVHDDVELFAMGHDMTDERAARQRDQQQERLAAVGTLAAGLAHEIRNPLNGAQLHVSFLERSLNKLWGASSGHGRPDEPDRTEVLEAVGIVRDEIKRLARLVTDFLDFARPRPLSLVETSVRHLCERAAQLVSAQTADAVALQLDLPRTDIMLEADKDRLEQLLLNLLQNAVEAVEPRGGTVILRARRQPRHAWIEVEDDGPGLPPGNAPVFDAFFSTKPNGTGLGLAIAHRVVTDHGGTIDVDSKPGRTRFRVVLPLSIQGAAE